VERQTTLSTRDQRGRNTEEKVICGVLGAGWWATYAHIPALLSHPKAQLVAIQKRDAEEAKKVASDFKIPRAVTSVEELLAIEGMRAIVVSSSPNVHYAHAAAALRKGIHVLVEKPMTITAQQAKELVEMAEANKAQLLISCPWHYTQHGQQARRLINSNRLGRIRMISILMTNPVAQLLRGESTRPTHSQQFYLSPRQGTYSDPSIAGGGQIYTQVSHVAAYLTFLTGARPAEVFARFHNDGSLLDIYDTLSVRLENECLVTIASTGATALEQRDYEVRVFGTEAILFLDLWRGHMRLVGLNGEVTSFPDLEEPEIYPGLAPAQNLIDSVFDPSQNLSPGSLGLAAMEVIEAACQSAVSGQNVAVRSAARELR